MPQPGGLYDPEFGPDFMMWALSQIHPELTGRPKEPFVMDVSPEHEQTAAAFSAADVAKEEKAKRKILKTKEDADLKKQAQQDSLDAMLDMPDRARALIRAQAAAAGRAGGLGTGAEPTFDDYAAAFDGTSATGGVFSQGEMTPELAARNAETEQWVGRQPERDLAYAMTPEQARRNPEYAATAGEKLTGLRSQRTQDRQVDINEQRVANQESLINSLTGSGGKIPFETAMKLEVSGMQVPTFAIGMSKDAAKGKMQDIRQMTQKSINDAMLEGLPESTISYLQYVMSVLPEFEKMIDAGQDPDMINKQLMELINRHAQQSGARQVAMQRAAAMRAAQGEQ